MSRIARLIALGYPHHIIIRGNNQEKVFFGTLDRKNYLRIVRKYTNKWQCEILSYCLMLNHIHLLLVPSKEESLAKTMQAINLAYTHYINKKNKRSGRIWGSRFYSSIVDKDEYLWQVIKYIETNPIRAKLAENAEDYLWSSAHCHIYNTKDSLAKSVKFISEKYDIFKGIDFKTYLSQTNFNQVNHEYITKKTLQNKPIGNKFFLLQF